MRSGDEEPWQAGAATTSGSDEEDRRRQTAATIQQRRRRRAATVALRGDDEFGRDASCCQPMLLDVRAAGSSGDILIRGSV